VIGSGTAPARQPSKSPPIERGGPGNGVDLRANNSLAGVDGAVTDKDPWVNQQKQF
jgi:hypothetical protein